jgi:hypothetical protein
MINDDKKFYLMTPDPGFSPERNKRIIQKTIEKYEQEKLKRMRLYKDKLGERTDAVATYLCSRAADSNKPIERYIGKKELAYLQGKKIMSIMKNGMRILQEAN